MIRSTSRRVSRKIIQKTSLQIHLPLCHTSLVFHKTFGHETVSESGCDYSQLRRLSSTYNHVLRSPFEKKELYTDTQPETYDKRINIKKKKNEKDHSICYNLKESFVFVFCPSPTIVETKLCHKFVGLAPFNASVYFMRTVSI